MTEIALVLLVLGFLFATLQYPALMKRFWKWTLIGVTSVALAIAATVVVIAEREAKRDAELKKAAHEDAFSHLMPGYNVLKRQDRLPQDSLEERVDEALRRAAMPQPTGKN